MKQEAPRWGVPADRPIAVVAGLAALPQAARLRRTGNRPTSGKSTIRTHQADTGVRCQFRYLGVGGSPLAPSPNLFHGIAQRRGSERWGTARPPTGRRRSPSPPRAPARTPRGARPRHVAARTARSLIGTRGPTPRRLRHHHVAHHRPRTRTREHQRAAGRPPSREPIATSAGRTSRADGRKRLAGSGAADGVPEGGAAAAPH